MYKKQAKHEFLSFSTANCWMSFLDSLPIDSTIIMSSIKFGFSSTPSIDSNFSKGIPRIYSLTFCHLDTLSKEIAYTIQREW